MTDIVNDVVAGANFTGGYPKREWTFVYVYKSIFRRQARWMDCFLPQRQLHTGRHRKRRNHSQFYGHRRPGGQSHHEHQRWTLYHHLLSARARSRCRRRIASLGGCLRVPDCVRSPPTACANRLDLRYLFSKPRCRSRGFVFPCPPMNTRHLDGLTVLAGDPTFRRNSPEHMRGVPACPELVLACGGLFALEAAAPACAISRLTINRDRANSSVPGGCRNALSCAIKSISKA